MDKANPLGLEPPLITPDVLIDPLPGCPRVAVLSYSRDIVDAYATEREMEHVADIPGTPGARAVWRSSADGHPFLLAQVLTGAPGAVTTMEELSAMGCEAFVVFGSCGMLNESAVGGIDAIIPSRAWADEGTSAHYGRDPHDPWVALDDGTVAAVERVAGRLGMGCATVPVWTTDAFYRETRSVVDARREAGCAAVEMEVSALAQAARALGLTLYAYLYGADSLDGRGYSKNDLQDFGMARRDGLLRLAEGIVAEHYASLAGPSEL